VKKQASPFQIAVHVDEKCLSVPSDSTIVGAEGIFLRGIRLPERTPVVLQIRKAGELIVLRGIVCADCGELGAAVQFRDVGKAESQILAHMLVA
jgi:hypothetical protein